MSTIEDLTRKVQSLRDQLKAASESLIAAKEAACPVKRGDLVLCKGIEYRITHIRFHSWDNPEDKPWLMGNPKRKDGTFGTAERHLYGDWTKR